MKIEKFIELSDHVEIELSNEDIRLFFLNDEDYEDKAAILLNNLNSIAKFLKAVPGKIIKELTEQQKEVISDFFKEQAERFKNGS